MSGYIAGELFSIAVLPDGEPVPAVNTEDEAVTFRITMAAIDPTAVPKSKGQVNGSSEFVGSVLKILRVDEDEYESDEDDDEESMDMAKLLDQASDDSSDDEEVNGGPSDPSKSNKAKRKAALKEAIANAEEDDEDEDMDVDGTSPARKGKAKTTDDDSLDSETEGTEIEGAEEFVICTLDPTKVRPIMA